MKILEIENIICYIGKDANDNWNILKKVENKDLYFHLSSFSSCYVIAKYNKDIKFTKKHIIKCAQLCKDNTKYKNQNNIIINYCECNNIMKGENIGEVIYKNKNKVNKIKI
jgi:hypothetical protein